jgi:hypothetical protein
MLSLLLLSKCGAGWLDVQDLAPLCAPLRIAVLLSRYETHSAAPRGARQLRITGARPGKRACTSAARMAFV